MSEAVKQYIKSLENEVEALKNEVNPLLIRTTSYEK
jgi:hypothetical protein